MAYQIERQHDGTQGQQQSRRGGETRTIDTVCITSLPFYRFTLIVRSSSLEGIEKRSRMLLDKGKVAKILDKKQDSGMIVKLVEELRQAILIYQVGTVENRRSTRVNASRVAVATTVYRQSSHSIDCESPPNVVTVGTDGRSAESSRLLTRS